jgi:hypothetical protein
MRVGLTKYITPKALGRLSTGLSVAAIAGALTAALAPDLGRVPPRSQVPIEILRTKPHPLPLPRKDPEPPRQTN